MRYLILSDIHANWEALEAVMRAAQTDGFDQILCLGDIVGYGADPNVCADWVRAHVPTVVRGNHDKAAVGLVDLEWFNPAARAAIHWTEAVLTDENREYLTGLPRGPLPVDAFQILHGSPVDEDEYLIQASEAAMVAGYLETPISFFGHTHVQGGFRFVRNMVRHAPQIDFDADRLEYEIDPASFYLINPGSVGQPRDGDPRAAWALYAPEDRLVIYRRVSYPWEITQTKILDAGLPDLLAHRLSFGQ